MFDFFNKIQMYYIRKCNNYAEYLTMKHILKNHILVKFLNINRKIEIQIILKQRLLDKYLILFEILPYMLYILI